MGSSGTGRLSDYSRKSKGKPGGKISGSSSGDSCDAALTAILEDVERCSYFENHRSYPERGTEVVLSLRGRLSVDALGGETIGYLPTRYNYLAGCIKKGYSYEGQVSSITQKPILRVQVDIGPA